MFLRRLFRKKCQDYKYENPFNTDVDFELLPLRQKVEILRSLCDFRLDAEDVELALSNLDSDSLRVEPLGHDRSNSAYWYFYGTRLYREDYISPDKALSPRQTRRARDKRRKKRRIRGEKVVEKEEEEEEENEADHLIADKVHDSRTTVWQVVCFTPQDWSRLVDKFKDSEYDTERKLYHTLSEDFLPEIPKLFELKEKQQRRRLLERNTRVQRGQESAEPTEEAIMVRAKMKTKAKATRRSQTMKNGDSEDEAPPPAPPQKKGRQTNNSLASADGQIVIHTRDELEGPPKKGLPKHTSTYVSSYPYTFGIEEEERRVGMHKVLESLKDHVDAWPFVDPVDEEYAPRYYSVVRKPMDLSTMEEKLEGGSYKNLSQFKKDFRLIVDNCRQYNGSDNEYTEMAVNLKEAFDRAVDRYLESEPSSDECPSVPASPNAIPSSPYPARASSSPSLLSSTRKRNKRSKQKSKSNKSEKKSKGRGRDEEEEDEDDEDEEEEKEEEEESPRDKRGKKRSKRAKEEEERNEDNNDDDENGAISESSVIKSKRKKYSEVERLLPKSKKLSAKEEKSEESNKRGKNRQKEQLNKNSKEHRESRRKKEDFEEDHEPLINIKSKSKRIEKRGIEDNAGLADRISRKQKKPEKIVEESDDERSSDVEENGKQTPEKKKNRSKKDKTSPKAPKVDVKHDRKASKLKEKKSKVKKIEDRPKNGELKKVEREKDTKKEDTASKKFDSLVSNKDLESLDSLKDRISERRREDKLKQERERAKKSTKIDTEKKKVPSNGNTYHESAKVNLKRAKLKKPVKDDKALLSKDETVEIKKPKLAHVKHGKNREESPAIQALNQATEQTLNDINKWLDDAPKLSEFSSGSDSPQTKQPSTSETSSRGKPEPLVRKRPTSVKFLGPNGPPRPKKVQRTIDRLQPGKAKGNLLLKKPLPSGSNSTDTSTSQSTTDVDHPSKDNTDEPKLSLGTVLKNSDSIQLMCKSLVSSPNPNLSNEDEEDDRPALATSKVKEEDKFKETKDAALKIDPEQVKSTQEESHKPKSATPNLSAWFKAFGAPKSKKKEEEVDEPAKKEEFQELPQRQRRMSAGGSSVSESVSSFSQESPPGLTIRSPQSQPALTPTAIEQPIRAGFYQDALSTGSSPNNSPYYATPPRYSAQLPPTPSPQNYSHPLSPAYPSSAAYDQNPLYPQLPQASHQVYQKPGTQENPPEAYPTYSQNSPQPENYINSPQQLPTNQKLSPVYPQPSPQAPVYPQNSPQPPPANYSQPSPQQPTTPNYSQPSPQQPTANYSQPSPQNPTYSQPSPQQQHSPYSQSSPQPPPSYSQPSPQGPNSPYSQPLPSPKPPPSYSQVSPQAPSPYSQPSPQFAQPSPQPPANYSQPSPQNSTNYSQPSPGSRNFAQHSPQPPSYSQPSPQSLNYSQTSPQQPPKYSQPSPQAPNYSQHSPQQQNPSSTGYSAQLSPQPARIYPQPSPQPCPLPVRPPANYSQPSPRAPAQSTPQNYQKSEEYAGGSYPQGFKSNHSPYVPPVSAAPVEAERRVEYLKPEEKLPVQQMETPRNFTSDPPLGLNHQVYQSNQFPPGYGNNYSSTGDPQRPGSRLNPQETPQQTQERHFDPETLKYQRQDQSQLLNFQQNLSGHDTIYQPAGGFQAPPYPMPNPSCRPVYPSPHYYDASAKSSSSSVPSSGASTLAPVKKRMYNEPTSDTTRTLPEQQSRGTQEQFGYDQMMTLATSEPGQNLVSGQFEGGFGSLDSVAGNSAYARLGLGLVGRSSKDQQQLLSIPRPSSKDALSYRQPGPSDLDLNLLQSLQNAAAKTIPPTHSRRDPPPAPAPTKGRKSKKKAQAQAQQQASIPDQQMPGFSQYPGNPGDPIGLKNSPAIPPGGSAFNFATPAGGTNSSPFYDKDASAAAAAFAFLDEFRNPNSYYSILRQQQQGQPQATPVTEAGQQANKLNNQPPRNYPPHPFLHSPQRSAPYGPPVSAYVSPHGPNLGVDPAAYQQYIHSLYALQPPTHHRPSWL
ncbi:bromodomain-containing protein 4 isoform X2 [Diachasmimorpha longicaudata]